MNTLTLPPRSVLDRWIALVPRDRPEMLAACQYLILGEDLAGILRLPEPETQVVTEILRLLRDRAGDILVYARDLAEELPVGRGALLELAVDELVAQDGWRHPSQVLDRPRPEYSQLLPICRRRLQQASKSQRRHLEEVTANVETAARIADEARKRRERMLQRR